MMHTPPQTRLRRQRNSAAIRKTVETVGIPRQACLTQLKLGVKERKPRRGTRRNSLVAALVTWAAWLLADGLCQGATNEFQPQLITLPFNANAIRFVPLEEHGRAALLAVDPVQHRLLIYRQRPWGFTNVADQVMPLPPRTAWVAPCDVDAHPGLELVMSTAKGVVYHRQNNGFFEAEPRTLVNADQVFTNDDAPRLLSLATNTSLPVIAMTQAVLYTRNSAYEWQSASPVTLTRTRSGWGDDRSEWTLGQNRSRGLHISETFQAGPKETAVQANDSIGKLVEELRKDTSRPIPGTNTVDINHDGKMDFVLWQVIPALEPRTDIYLFLAEADGRLPDKPSQVLHCRGVPIPLDSTDEQSALVDLKRDGNFELVLMEIKSPLTSSAGILEMALSMGIDCGLAIRTFHDGAFSVAPDARIPCTLLIGQQLQHWPTFVCGDVNGDGRPDLLVQRSTTQWNIYLSMPGDDWFTVQPAITFDTPLPGYLTLEDLNGDGRADIVVRQWDDPRVYILLSRPRSTAKP